MKTLKRLLAATVLSAGTLALPLHAYAGENADGNGGAGSHGEYRLETRAWIDRGDAPLSVSELEKYQLGAAASKASVKSVSK